MVHLLLLLENQSIHSQIPLTHYHPQQKDLLDHMMEDTKMTDSLV